MQHIITPVTDTPDIFSDADLQRFEDLVIKGGEVGGAVLTDNIAHARILAVYRKKSLIFGVAALKQPKEGYRKKTEARSGITLLNADYPFELGYIFWTIRFKTADCLTRLSKRRLNTRTTRVSSRPYGLIMTLCEGR